MEENFSNPIFTLIFFEFICKILILIFFLHLLLCVFSRLIVCTEKGVIKRQENQLHYVSLKDREKNIIWKFLWHGALLAAADLIPIPYMGLLTQGHIREWLRTGEAMTKVRIDPLFPWYGCLCRKHWSVVQPERRLNELMEEKTLRELLNTQKISLAWDVAELQVLCSREERLLAILRSHAPRSNISFWA